MTGTSMMSTADAREHVALVRRTLPMSVTEHALLAVADSLNEAEAAVEDVRVAWQQRYNDLQAEYRKRIEVLERQLGRKP